MAFWKIVKHSNVQYAMYLADLWHPIGCQQRQLKDAVDTPRRRRHRTRTWGRQTGSPSRGIKA